MLDFNAPKYTPQEVLTLFRAIGKHLKTMPQAFEAQGVFRVSGANQHILQIIDDILKNNPFVHRKYTVHDYVGVLKYALLNGDLLGYQDIVTQNLKEKVVVEDIAVGQVGVYDFIKKLSHSSDRNHFIIAEIFYQFLHQLTSALAFQHKNKMTAANLGIIAGPFFADFIEDNPKHILDTTLKLNQICAGLIAEGQFKKPFENIFGDVVDTWREKDLAELEQIRSQLLKQKETDLKSHLTSRTELAKDKKKLKEIELKIHEFKSPSQPNVGKKLFFSLRRKRAADKQDGDAPETLTKFLRLKMKHQ